MHFLKKKDAFLPVEFIAKCSFYKRMEALGYVCVHGDLRGRIW